MEKWRDITGYEGYYQVSSEGRVRSLDRTTVDKLGRKNFLKGKEIYQSIVNSGYYQVNLYNHCKASKKYVHQLVAIEFIDNPNNYTEVNHMDCDKSNNTVGNLEWCTHLYNIIDLRNKKYNGFKDSHNRFGYYKCVDCGKKISYGSKRCPSCASKKASKKYARYNNGRPLSRKEVEDSLIKEKGNFTKASKKLNMTDNALRKWCIKYKLPFHSKDWKTYLKKL